jgi:hypothetical protein
MIITIYNASGEIGRTFNGPESVLLMQVQNGEDYIIGEYHSNTHYIDVDTKAAIELPAKPSSSHTFDYATKQWVDPRTLNQIKATQWESIKVSRAIALTSPVQTPYGAFDATDSGQKSITDAVLMLQTLQALGTPTTIDFTLADNTVVTLDTTKMVTVGLMLGQQTQAAYAKGRALRNQIEAAARTTEVEAIVW